LSLDTYLGGLPNYYFRWHQIAPSLIPANLGDFVLIYNEHYSNDEDSEVGIVTSIISENNEISYGCAYFIPTLNDSFGNQRYDFTLTSDDYGGYKEGFIKILSE
jgi:hypothetical protein